MNLRAIGARQGRREACAGIALFLTTPVTATLQSPTPEASVYPSRVVHYVVPYAAGGPTDSVGRLVAEELSALWGHPVVVDNRPGANAAIGAEFVARAAADGHTLLQGTSSTHGSNPAVFPRLGYRPVEDFIPVVQLIEGPVYLAVGARSRIHSVHGLVIEARHRPGEMNYGTSGPGSPQHLAGELLAQRAGIKLVAVHYTGASAALLALQRGEIDFYFDSTAPMHEKAGRLRVLGVASSERWPLVPHVPTLAEGGIADFDVRGWFGLFAPAGTPAEVVARINSAVNGILALPRVAAGIQGLGYRAVGGSSAAFADRVRHELVRWAELVRAAGLRVE